MNKNNFLKNLNLVSDQVAKCSPAILVFLGLTGMISTMVMVGKVSPEAKIILDDLHGEADDTDSKVRQIANDVIAVAPIFAPAIIMGSISTVCIISSYKINTKRIAALATAYSISERSLHEYQNKVIETFGEKKEEKLRGEIAKDRVRDNPVSNQEVIVTDGGSMLCYDSISGRYFRSNINIIRKAEWQLNRRLNSEMYVSLNDFYDEIEIPQNKIGDDIGWNVDHPIEFTFGSILMDDDVTCLVVDYELSPRYDFRNLR